MTAAHMTAAQPDRRLSKRAVETMLATYDHDPVGALETALRWLCDRPEGRFDELLQQLVAQGRLSPIRYRALTQGDLDALDSLARELNETRTLPS